MERFNVHAALLKSASTYQEILSVLHESARRADSGSSVAGDENYDCHTHNAPPQALDLATDDLSAKCSDQRTVRPQDTILYPDGPGSAPWDSEEWDDSCELVSQLPLDGHSLASTLRGQPSYTDVPMIPTHADAKLELIHRLSTSSNQRYNPYAAVYENRDNAAGQRVYSDSSNTTSQTSSPSSSPTISHYPQRVLNPVPRDGNATIVPCDCAVGYWDSNAENVQKHLTRLHNIPQIAKFAPNKVTCPLGGCTHAFQDMSSLARHVKGKHYGVGFKCDFCSTILESRLGKERHEATHHRRA
ncbi:hypothetical protein AAF712_006128 [Marasmius tenuissimus]|uniref:C2H2-type domain-containing protein n=1 Tax=Marasmius tenuissimus TaxID=585030 RepID=A0ABR2ZYG1_9AGAR